MYGIFMKYFKPHIVKIEGKFAVRFLSISLLGWRFVDAHQPLNYLQGHSLSTLAQYPEWSLVDSYEKAVLVLDTFLNPLPKVTRYEKP